MEYKTLELNLTSAKDLKNVNLFAKMEVYAVVSISGDPLHTQNTKTPIDKQSGTNPAWNFPVKLTFNETLARQNRLALEINLRCARNLASDKDIGSVQIPLRVLQNQTGDGKSFHHVSYQVRKPSGKPKGAFSFSYKFIEPVKSEAENVTTYPAPVLGSTYAHYTAPPQYPAGYGYQRSYGGYQQPQAGYGYPQQFGYGYPAQNGYRYPGVPVQKA